MPDVFWDSDPTFQPHLPVQVSAPRSGQTLLFWLLGPNVGTFLHWVKQDKRRRTVPCLRAKCPHCPDPDRTWKGWVPALIYNRNAKQPWSYSAAEFTELAHRELLNERKPEEFRGTIVELYRGNTNSHVHCRVLETPKHALPGLPPPFDVRKVVERLLGLSRTTPGDGTPNASLVIPLPPVNLPPLQSLQAGPPETGKRATTLKLAEVFRQAMNGGGK